MTAERALRIAVAVCAVLAFVAGAVWWASDLSARMRSVEQAVAPLDQMKVDIAFIRGQLDPLNNRSTSMK